MYTLILVKKIIFLFLLTSSFIIAEEPTKEVDYATLLSFLYNLELSSLIKDLDHSRLFLYNFNEDSLPAGLTSLKNLKILSVNLHPNLRFLVQLDTNL